MLTYEMVTGEHPGEDEESPPVDETTLQKAATQEAFFVDFLRADEYDEDGVREMRYPVSSDMSNCMNTVLYHTEPTYS